MINKKFLGAINEYGMFLPGDNVLVAVSGGADSTALLNLLHQNKESLGITLHVAHLNHLLRRGDAEIDARFVESLAQRIGCPATIESIDVADFARQYKMGIEAAARKVRYEFFEKTAAAVGASKIAVGHTADDNVETFLMRLLRGSGIKGLTGIPPKRRQIVRPLIKIWRREIEDYVGSIKLVPRRDHTNYESRYMRNSVRLKLIPQLRLYNMNIKEIILQTILLLTEDNLYLENQANEAFEDLLVSHNGGDIKLNIDRLRKNEATIQRYVLRQAIEKVKGDLSQVSFNHIREIISMLGTAERWELHLPEGIFVLGDGGKLVFSLERPKLKETKVFRKTLPVPGEAAIKEIGRTIRCRLVDKMDEKENSSAAFADYASLGREIIVRTKADGDRFVPLGMKGMKKLQDFFVDEKIPIDDRNNIPIVESAGKIVWIAGLRLDDRSKVTSKTKKILKFEII